MKTEEAMARDEFVKVYKRADLLDNCVDERIRCIEDVSTRFEFVPTVRFSEGDNELIYRQERITRKPCSTEALIESLSRLSADLECLHQMGFVHGDINYKNVMHDGALFRLVDMEPSLRQVKNGRSTLLYTPPYISLGDYQNDHLTSATDKIGYYFLCRRLLCPIEHFSPMHRMKRIAAGESCVSGYVDVNEDGFVKLSYRQILNLCRDVLARRR